MNYLKIYCNLIRKAEDRTPPEDCVEKHHTFPKGIFGDNKRIVILTPREHYVAHLLLEQIHIKRYGVDDERTKKMTLACLLMRSRSEKYNSHLYEQIRKRHSENMKEKMKGEGNPSYGVPCSEERKQKIREKNLGRKASQEARDKMSRARKGIRRGTYLRKGIICGTYLKIYDLKFKENFIEIVEQSHNKMEVLRKLGYKGNGRFNCINEWIKELNLNTSHFTGNFGRIQTEETRQKIKEAKTGEKNSFYGKKHTKEVREKMSEKSAGNKNAFYGKTHSEETKKKQAEAKIGRKCWNNGKVNKMSKECPGDGWVRGKLKGTS